MAFTQNKIVQIGGIVLILGLAFGLAVWSLLGGGGASPGPESKTGPVEGVPIKRDEAFGLKNPYEENEQFIAEGKRVFQENCVSCHGTEGKLPNAHNFRSHSSQHSDGDYVWVVTYGINGTPMVGHADKLSLEERWQVIRYIKTTFPSTPAEETK